MDRHNFDRGDRGGLANLELGELYYPLERMVMSHSTLSQEYSTSCDISVAGVPSNFTNIGGFTWSSSNSNVCTVVKTGQFTATINFVSQGNCTISCDHIEAGTSIINCTALPIRLTSFDLSTTSLSQEYSTKAIVSVGVFRPVTFTNVAGFVWSTNNAAVCNVSKINNTEAEINFIAQGNATITIKHPDLPAKTIACVALPVKLKSYALSTTSLSQEYSTSASVSVGSFAPSNFTNVGGFTWSTNNGSVCTVTKVNNTAATINFIAQGSCTISCTHPDLPTKTISCTALPVKLRSYNLSTTSLSQEYSTSANVSVNSFVPANFTNVGGFTWSSSNSNVCTVTKVNNTAAKINFIAQGNATITVRHPDLPAKTIACVALPIKLKSYALSTTSLSQEYNTSASVSVGSFAPSNFTNVGGFTWSSNNTGVCTVSKTNNTSATINFVAMGIATITVNHPDVGSKTIACLSMLIRLKSFAISPNAITCSTSDEITVRVNNQVPSNFTNVDQFRWESSNGSIAYADKRSNYEAHVNCMQPGNCVISCQHPEAEKQDIQIVVLNPTVNLTSFTLSSTRTYIMAGGGMRPTPGYNYYDIYIYETVPASVYSQISGLDNVCKWEFSDSRYDERYSKGMTRSRTIIGFPAGILVEIKCKAGYITQSMTLQVDT